MCFISYIIIIIIFILIVCLLFPKIAGKTLQNKVKMYYIKKDYDMMEDQNERIDRIMEELDPMLKQSID